MNEGTRGTVMDQDTSLNGMAHELWAMAQGRAAIEDVVEPMMTELATFAHAIRAAERGVKVYYRELTQHYDETVRLQT